MKKFVWTFGLIAGGIMAAMMTLTIVFEKQFGWGQNEVFGYTTMLLAFLMVYFGIRSYRDNVMAGSIGFGRAFKVGVLITVVASTCYVAAWEVSYHTVATDFVEKYAARSVEKARTSGATDAEVAATKAEMDKFAVQYKNPAINIAYTYIEVLPLGIVVTLVSAGVLSRKRNDPTPMMAGG
ncbi:MAG: DUF4199 domain-containing protein [Gemmatimonadota bacterium]